MQDILYKFLTNCKNDFIFVLRFAIIKVKSFIIVKKEVYLMHLSKKFIASAAAVLAVLMLAAGAMAGCAKDEGSDAAETTAEAAIEATRVINGYYTDRDGNPLTDSNGEAMTAPEIGEELPTDAQGRLAEPNENSESSQSSQNSASSSKSESSKSSASSKTSSSKASSSSKTSEKSSSNSGGGNNSSKVLNIGSKSFEIGDTVVQTYSLSCAKDFINYQATVSYDGKYLKVVSAKLQKPASSGGILNANLDQEIKFNGVNLSGYDYADGGAFLVVEYEVLASGSTSPSITWEVITDMNNNSMLTNGKGSAPVSDFKITESFEKK